MKEGDKVIVKKHKCGIDVIGPFETVINYIEDGIADVTDPLGNDWGVSLRHLTKRVVDGASTPANKEEYNDKLVA